MNLFKDTFGFGEIRRPGLPVEYIRVTDSPEGRATRAARIQATVLAMDALLPGLLESATEEADPAGAVLGAYVAVTTARARLSAHLMKLYWVKA